jgi:hypothetical protein
LELGLIELLVAQSFSQGWIEALRPIPVAAQDAPHGNLFRSTSVFWQGPSPLRQDGKHLHIVALMCEPLANIRTHHLIATKGRWWIVQTHDEEAKALLYFNETVPLYPCETFRISMLLLFTLLDKAFARCQEQLED